MSETISIQRGLNELKLLDKRIKNAMFDGDFVSISIGNKPVRGFKDNDDFNKQAQSKYQSVVDLIRRRNVIKSAIVKANATTYVTIGSETMTIAEAIERKTSINYEKQFLQELREQYQITLSHFEQKDDYFKNKLDQHLETLYGKEGKSQAKENKEAIKPFLEMNEPHFVDPLGLKAKIDELQEYIYTFESEVDFTLAEANIKTEVVIEG